VPVAGSTHLVTLPLTRTATLLVHQRSVPSSVASSRNGYACVPPAASSTGTDRSCTLVRVHIRSIIGEVALPALNGMGGVPLRVNYMAPLAPSR
jgi:hypothetical protein